MILPEKYNVCAVVTSFNPDTSFYDRLNRVAAQVDKIVIVDNNSGLHVLKNLKDISKSFKMHFIFNSINFGVATALNQGVKWAYKNNYKWVLLLDQDTIVAENLVEKLCDSFKKMDSKEKIGIIGPGYYNIKNLNSTFRCEPEDKFRLSEVKYLITSGSLIPISLFERIGPFRDELFIDFIDIEYCLRARKEGYKVVKLDDKLMQHSIGAVTMHKIPWKTTGTSNHSALRRYYMMRNNIIVAKQYFHKYPGWVIGSLFGRVKSIFLMILFEKQRMRKLKFSILGFHDGLLGKVNRFSDLSYNK